MFDVDVEDEVARLAMENPGKIQLTAPANRAYYPVEQDGGLTPYDIERCRDELTGRVGLTPEDVWVLTEGSTVEDQAEALIALAAEVDREEAELAELAVSAEARDRLAEKGKGFALPDGSYPVHDAHHLGIAKAFFKQGKHGSHHPAEIKAHINKAAARLGLPGLDDDGDDDTEDRADREVARRKPRSRRYPHHTKPVQVARRGQHQFFGEGGEAEGGAGPSGAGEGGATLAARRVAVRTPHGYRTLALTSDQAGELGYGADRGGPVDRIMARNPELFLANTDAKRYNPAAVGPFDPGPGGHVGKHFDFEVHEVSRDDTENDTRTTDEIARLLAVADSVMGREKPYGSVNRYAPKSVAARNAAESRELADGRAQNRIER
jgi:hypothetical protein